MDFFVDQLCHSYQTLKATKSFLPGEVLIDLSTAEEVLAPDYMSIDLGDKHVYHPVARYVNHSCEPNAFVDCQQQKLIAKTEINKNDEITFNYLISERQITAPFDCNCCSDTCVGRVEKYLPRELCAV
jgi:hypothetical protein